MKRWWANISRDYFTFTKRERNGVAAFFMLAALIYLVTMFWPTKKANLPNTAFQQQIAQLKISIDTNRGFKNYRRQDDEAYQQDYYQPKPYNNYNKNNKGELFAFDPNTLDIAGWKRLGLRDKTIRTIQNFIGKGYKFRQATDLKKIYGLHAKEAERLIPYVQIAGSATEQTFAHPPATSTPFNTDKNVVKHAPRIIDINSADTSSLIALPGIGSKLATRIINFREKLGGFVNIQQVAETYGVPDSTFQKIKSLLQCPNPLPKTINVNVADASQLRSHPYIKWNIANAIVNYRQQHGNFTSLNDLKKIDIISAELFQKIAPYLTLS